MDDLISRESVIEIIESVCSADDSYWQPGTLEKIRNLPTHPTPSNTLGALDCVERQKAIDAFMKATGDGDKVDFCIGVIKSVPSAQPRRGKWIYGEHDVAMCDGYRCDKCGFFVPWDYQHKFIDFINEYNFCPNCGADMRGGTE